MTKDVIVKIRGLQAGQDLDGEPIEMITKGEYFFKNGKHYLLYDEVMENETAVTKNRMKVAPGLMELKKSGLVSVHMVFEEHKENLTQYHTPYGTLTMGITAHEILLHEDEDAIDIAVDYALSINEEHTADCNIKISVRPQGKSNFQII